jgi:hypothetical protein
VFFTANHEFVALIIAVRCGILDAPVSPNYPHAPSEINDYRKLYDILNEVNKMQEIIIDEEFRLLLPTLDEETFRLLEESLLEHGCRDPLVLWNGILIDGYNRFKICSHHNLPFQTVDMEFDSRENVIIWIITNQISRRNLTSTQLSHFRGLHYNADKELHGGKRRGEQKISKGQNDPLKIGSTATRLSDQYNVSPKTIKRDAKLADGLTSIGEISPEIKRKILDGEVKIGKSRLEALSEATPEEVEAVIQEIKDGTFVSRPPRTTQGDATQGDGSPVLTNDDAGNDDSDGNIGDASVSVPNNDKQTGGDNSSNSFLPEIRQLNAIISSFASSIYSALREINDGDSTVLKDVLRSYINQLEDLYKNL